MKKLRNLLLVGTALTLGLTSCNNNDGPDNGDGDNVARFTSNINPLGTRVANNAWEATDEVGVFATTSGAGLTTSSYALNKRYVVDNATTGHLIGAAGEEIYFPEDGSNLDFIAYYPYQAAATTTLAYDVDVTDQSDFSKIDLLYSNNLTAKNHDATDLSLQFGHKLSMVRMEIASQGSFADMSGLTVKITGVKTGSSFNLADGTFTDDAATGEITAMVTPSGGNATATVEAMVIPASDLTGVSFVFEVEGNRYTYSALAGKTFTSGIRHTYSFTLQSSGSVTGFESNQSGIGGWGDTDEGGGDIDIDPVGGDGTQSNPFTVTNALANVGETGVWVEGFVVGVDENMTRAAGNNFEPPFISNTNILLAASAGETDMANCITVVLPTGAIADALNLVDNQQMLGKKVKVQGDIKEDNDGKFMDTVTAQEGGVEPGPGPGGEAVEFFKEAFNDAGTYGSGNRPKIAAMQDWDMWTTGSTFITYTDSFGNADIRSTTTVSPSVWFPAVVASAPAASELVIDGLDQLGSFTNVNLTYDIAPNNINNASPAHIVVMYDLGDGNFISLPEATGGFTANNAFITIGPLDLPDGVKQLRFYSEAGVNTIGYRIDNVILKGVPAN